MHTVIIVSFHKKVLCSSSLDLSAADSRGYTCAHLAAAHGKCSALQAILKTGENIERLDQRGWSVLHHAAYHGRLGIIQVSNCIKGHTVELAIEGHYSTSDTK